MLTMIHDLSFRLFKQVVYVLAKAGKTYLIAFNKIIFWLFDRAVHLAKHFAEDFYLITAGNGEGPRSLCVLFQPEMYG